jgi:hypothetical protein
MKTCDTECVAPTVLNLCDRWQVAKSPDRLVPGDGTDTMHTSSNLSPAGSRSPFHSCSARNPVTIVTELSGIMFSSGLQEAQEINHIDRIVYR